MKGEVMKTNVTASSIATYHDIHPMITGECYRKILQAMSPEKIYTRKQIARLTGLETSCVAGRINELLEMQQVALYGVIKCPVSGRMVQGIKKVEG